MVKKSRGIRKFTADWRYFQGRKNLRSVPELWTRVSDPQSSAAQLFSHSPSNRGKICSSINRFKMPFPAQMGYLYTKCIGAAWKKVTVFARIYPLTPLFFVSFFSPSYSTIWYRFERKKIVLEDACIPWLYVSARFVDVYACDSIGYFAFFEFTGVYDDLR